MQHNPIPGNPLSELPAPISTYTLTELQDRLHLLVGGQAIERRQEPRYVAEWKRLHTEIHRREDREIPTLTLAQDPQLQDLIAQARQTPIHAYVQAAVSVDAAVEALNALSGFEDNLRGQATEILLGMVPAPVEEAFTAVMERAERWNEED